VRRAPLRADVQSASGSNRNPGLDPPLASRRWTPPFALEGRMNDAEAARAYRLQQCAAIIEALTVIDPVTGEEVPCYEPDPE
jgi:hypothetical protein